MKGVKIDRLADLPCGIWLGSQWACDNALIPYGRVIHIVGAGQPHCCKRRDDDDLVIEMTERVPLGRPLIERIAEFAKTPSGLFVHCTAGMCRGPTAALVCLIARGRPPGVAMGEIADAMWTQYRDRITPWWEHEVISEIFDWSDTLGATR